jgi:pimeloyl-ACP methyl ester carboxylesterase
VQNATVRLTPRPRRCAALLVLAALVLSACSSGEDDAASRPTPTTATPSATASATASPGPSASRPAAAVPRPGRLSAWKGCGSGFQCATLTVLLDDARPELGTVGLALTRHKATGSKRIGSLVVNPGGPGASAIGYLQGSYDNLPSAIRSRFDLVAFDPRGVGRSAPVRCLSTQELDAYFHLDPAPDSAQERQALLAGNRKLAAGCARRSGRVLPYVNTQVVAQDLDRVRQAVKDPKLTYLGYSYGTAIGAAYLDQFPTRVRAMVLDGALDPRLTWDAFLRGQSKGFDTALAAFLENCEESGCAFRDAVDGDLGEAFDALARRVESQPLPGDGSRTVGPDELTLGVGAGLYSRRNGWPAIAEALAAAERGDGSQLLSLNDSYLERGPDGYENLAESNFAVNCIDRPWPRTEKPYYDLAAEVARTAPRFGPAIALSGLGCLAWPVPPSGRPHAVTGTGSPTVVVIGTTRDPATPYAWSEGLASQLSRAVLLTHVGDGHTIYRTSAPRCILEPVNAYLLTVTVPRSARC